MYEVNLLRLLIIVGDEICEGTKANVILGMKYMKVIYKVSKLKTCSFLIRNFNSFLQPLQTEG